MVQTLMSLSCCFVISQHVFAAVLTHSCLFGISWMIQSFYPLFILAGEKIGHPIWMINLLFRVLQKTDKANNIYQSKEEVFWMFSLYCFLQNIWSYYNTIAYSKYRSLRIFRVRMALRPSHDVTVIDTK
jgi:hypothetical protein